MPAEITETDHLAYVGETPWHGFGSPLEPGQSIEEWRAAARLTWQIRLAALGYKDARGKYQATDKRAMYRDDTGQLLDIVGPKYVPAQNDEVLDFFRQYVATGAMSLETAGSLKAGRYVWGLAKLRENFELAGGDEVRGHLLLVNPNIYGKGMIAKFVLERVVCWNTLTLALAEGQKQITLWHNRPFDAEARADAASKIGLAHDAFASLRVEAMKFSARTLRQFETNQVLAAAFETTIDPAEEKDGNRASRRVLELFEGAAIGADLPSAENTAWGLLNAVTQYTDHEYGRADTTRDTRLVRSWFGDGEQVKRRARTALWKLVAA